ncbi:MAG: HK97-gp10 family putative phage morphogenesis protein [Methanosarcinales archaeon]
MPKAVSGIEIKVQDDDMQRVLDEFGKSVSDDGIKAAFERIGDFIVAEAAKRCPVKTGRLRASLHVMAATPSQLVVGSELRYAAFQEYGTRKNPPQPHWRPAIEENREKIVNYLRMILKRERSGIL